MPTLHNFSSFISALDLLLKSLTDTHKHCKHLYLFIHIFHHILSYLISSNHFLLLFIYNTQSNRSSIFYFQLIHIHRLCECGDEDIWVYTDGMVNDGAGVVLTDCNVSGPVVLECLSLDASVILFSFKAELHAILAVLE